MSRRFWGLVLAPFILGSARADTFTWAGDGGTFSNPASWLGVAPAPGGSPPDQLIFASPVNSANAYTAILDSGLVYTLNALQFGTTNASSPASISINGVSGSSLLFDGPNPTISINPLADVGISIPVVTTSSLTVTGEHLSLGSTLTFSGSSGQLNLITTDFGYQLDSAPAGLKQVVVDGSDTAGSVFSWVFSSSVAPPSSVAFGGGPIILNNAACFGLYYYEPIFRSNYQIEMTTPFIIKGDGNEIGAVGFGSVKFSGPVQLGGNVLFYSDADTATLSGNITLDQTSVETLAVGTQAIGPTGTSVSITGNFIDDPGPSHTAHNPLHLYDIGGGMYFSGTANTYSTGTVIDQGTIIVASNSSLGIGDVIIGSLAHPWENAQLNISSPNSINPAARVDVYGTLALVGTDGAIKLTSAHPVLHPYSTLVLGDNVNFNTDRYPDMLPLSLDGATLELAGAGETNEVIGPVTFSKIAVVILHNPSEGTNTTILHVPSLSREDNGVLLITPLNGRLGQGSGNVNFVIEGVPQIVNGMYPPYIQLADNRAPTTPDPLPVPMTPSFVTAGPNGVMPVTYTAMPTNGGTGTEIVEVNGAVGGAAILSGNTSIYALRTSISIANTHSSSATLTIQGGGLITYNFATSSDEGNAITIAPNVDFGPGEALIHVATSQLYYDLFPTEISGKVTIRNGLTKLGFGSLVLSNPDNDINGSITVFQGDLAFYAIPQADSDFPISLYLNTSIDTQSTQTLRRPISFLSASATTAMINIGDGATLTLASRVTGMGGLTFNGGTLVLAPALQWQAADGVNSFSPVVLRGASVSIPAEVDFSGGLSGSGRISDFSSLFLEGTISPGTAPGDVATLIFDSPGLPARLGWFETVALDIASAGVSDQLLFNGPLTLEPSFLDAPHTTLALNFLTSPDGEIYTLISAPSLTGTFSQVTGLPDGYSVEYTSTSVLLIPDGSVPFSSVPEPAAWSTLATPAIALLMRRGSRNSRKRSVADLLGPIRFRTFSIPLA